MATVNDVIEQIRIALEARSEVENGRRLAEAGEADTRNNLRSVSQYYGTGQDDVSVYLRVGHAFYCQRQSRYLNALVIANVSVPVKCQQKGHFTALRKALQMLALAYGYEAVIVEQVHNTQLRDHLLQSCGYEEFRPAPDLCLGIRV